MRISDWSSDVCSSDLSGHQGARLVLERPKLDALFFTNHFIVDLNCASSEIIDADGREPLQESAEALGPRARPALRMFGCLMHVLNADFQALEDHLLLVAEIMIKRRLLRADGIGELVERSLLKAIVVKVASGGAQHLQPLCLAPDIQIGRAQV